MYSGKKRSQNDLNFPDDVSRARSMEYFPESYESGINLRTNRRLNSPTYHPSNIQNKNFSTKERYSSRTDREHGGDNNPRVDVGLPRISIANALPADIACIQFG